MLTEALIEEFTRDCPSTKILVSKVWGSLSLESKLQIINAFANNLPHWLVELTINDKDEVVKIWGMKNYDSPYNFPDDEELFRGVYGDSEYNSALAIQIKIKNDNSEIVKNISANEFIFFSDFVGIPQNARLIRLRHVKVFPTDMFIIYLGEIALGLSKPDLIDCLDEIIGNLDRYGFMIQCVSSIENLNKAWELLEKIDEDIALRLAKILPINTFPFNEQNIKGDDVKAELLLNLPRTALFWSLKQNQDNPTRELQKVAKIIIDDENNHYDEYVRELAWSIRPEDEFNSMESLTPENTDFWVKVKKYFIKY
jgi:hypothetical protein